MKQLSNCHKAPVTVDTADEGTSCYMCSECNSPCDLQIDKEAFLKDRGWFQWYNPVYWCHKQFGSKDCTNYGLSLDQAYEFQTNAEARKKILRGMNMVATGRKILAGLIK